MISTRDIPSYSLCKGKYVPFTSTDYTGLILERLKQRCPKLKPNRTWVKHYCDELDNRAKHYLDTLNKLSVADLKTIGNSLNINFGWLGGAGPSKNFLVDSIFIELIKCKNHETIYGESITEIDPKKLFKTRKGYCHHMDELLAYLISSGDGNLEPKDENNIEELWVNGQQKQKFLGNPFHDAESVKDYRQMVRSKQQQRDINLDLFKYIELIGKLGFILMNDEATSHAVGGFDNSIKAVVSFTKLLEQSPPGIKDKIMKFANLNSDSVSTLFAKINTTCIHGIGSGLVEIYLYQFQQLKKKFPQIQLLPLFKINGSRFTCIQFGGSKTYKDAVKVAKKNQIVYTNYYAPNTSGKIVRLHRTTGDKLSAGDDLKEMKKLVKEFGL